MALLVGHGLRVGIATHGPSDTREAVRQHGDRHRMVHGIAPPVHVGAAKPSPPLAMFLAALMGGDARQIVWVGGRAEDMLTAKRLATMALLVGLSEGTLHIPPAPL